MIVVLLSKKVRCLFFNSTLANIVWEKRFIHLVQNVGFSLVAFLLIKFYIRLVGQFQTPFPTIFEFVRLPSTPKLKKTKLAKCDLTSKTQ